MLEPETDRIAESVPDLIADKIVKQLSASVISSSFPARIGEWIREAYRHGAGIYRHVLPMVGSTALFAEYRLNPDGTLNLEFQDMNGCSFWRGTFRPEEAK